MRRASYESGSTGVAASADDRRGRSEEHTSELQSQSNLVCRLLLEKKKKENYRQTPTTRRPLDIPPPPAARISDVPFRRSTPPHGAHGPPAVPHRSHHLPPTASACA